MFFRDEIITESKMKQGIIDSFISKEELPVISANYAMDHVLSKLILSDNPEIREKLLDTVKDALISSQSGGGSQVPKYKLVEEGLRNLSETEKGRVRGASCIILQGDLFVKTSSPWFYAPNRIFFFRAFHKLVALPPIDNYFDLFFGRSAYASIPPNIKTKLNFSPSLLFLTYNRRWPSYFLTKKWKEKE